MKVALLANLKQNAPTWPNMTPDLWADLDSWETIQAITIALEKAGHRVTFLEGDVSLFNNLLAIKPDICFNICDGHFGGSPQSQIPAILDLLRIPYTGSGVLTQALAHDKAMTKRLLSYHGLPTPAFQVFERDDEPLDPHLPFPLSVKPSRKGPRRKDSVKFIVGDEIELRSQLRHIFDVYRQPALVEPFIEGRMVSIGIVGNLTAPTARRIPEDGEASRISEGLHFFPPLEVDITLPPTEETVLYLNQAQVDLAHNSRHLCPAPLNEQQLERLKWLAATAFRVMGCHDIARVDFQLDVNDHDNPYILEVNPLPGLSPDYSDLCLEATANGWHYEDLINRILDEAFNRHQLSIAETGLQHNFALEKLPLVA